MASRLRRQVDSLEGQIELYLVLGLLSIALLMILGLVACNFAMTCCQFSRSRRKKGRERYNDYSDEYFSTVQTLLKRHQILEREWEERKKFREEYRLMSPEEATSSLSQLASRNSSPSRIRRNKPPRPPPPSFKSENDLKGALDNYNVNHTVRIKTSSNPDPLFKRKSWAAMLEGKEIQLNEEDVIGGGSVVIVRRFEPMAMVDTVRKSSIRKDGQQRSRSFGSEERRQKKSSTETSV